MSVGVMSYIGPVQVQAVTRKLRKAIKKLDPSHLMWSTFLAAE